MRVSLRIVLVTQIRSNLSDSQMLVEQKISSSQNVVMN